MYLKQLELKNTGPIEHANIICQFNDDGSPKPVILVGQNGSGKSVATAHIASALISAHGTVFENPDVKKGKVYKLRSPAYIRNGATYSCGELHFSNDYHVCEIQLVKEKNLYTPPFPDCSKWEKIAEEKSTYYSSNFSKKTDELMMNFKKETHIFFPPNRFEEPAWLNERSLLNKATYASLERYERYSNRPVIIYAPMRDLQSWLLDLIYDSHAIEKKAEIVYQASKTGESKIPKIKIIQNGKASKILYAIEIFLRKLFHKEGSIIWNIGPRNRRKIGISINSEFITTNLFQLSTGQAVLLDLFLTIIRDFDIGSSQLTQLSDIKGIVVVDEIDLHLHTDLQHDLLPDLIRLFPNVQFILSTHSPLFLIGMEKAFKSDGFQLIELPSGQEIEVERFSEFEAAYRHMQNSARFEKDVRSRIESSQKPLLYLEGTTDIDYLKKAAEIIGKTEIINKFDLIDSVGFPHMNKIWETYKSHLGSTIKQKWILLYDCDANKPAENNGKLFRRTMPEQNHKILSGIENLFPDSTIQNAINYKADFVDISSAHTTRERGILKKIPEKWKINKDEKRNLCTWLCENGKLEDFIHFSKIFEILENILNLNADEKS